MNLPETAKLQEIYGETEKSSARFQKLADNFAKTYKHDKAEYFTSAGRTEIIGNHTDHNGGKVIAGSINLIPSERLIRTEHRLSISPVKDTEMRSL